MTSPDRGITGRSPVTTWRGGSTVTSPDCRNGIQTSCPHLVRVPMADGSLAALTEQPDDDRVPDLLALSDVMGTGASIRARCST